MCSQMRDTITNAIAENFSSSALNRDGHHSHIHAIDCCSSDNRNLSHLCHRTLTLSNPVQSKPTSIEKNPAEQQCQYKKNLSFFLSSFFKYMLTTAFAHRYSELKSSCVLLNETRTLHPTYAKQWRH